MKSYAQLKEGIVFSVHTSPDDVDDSGPDVWLIQTEDAESVLGKKYEDGLYVDAPKIKYATIDLEQVVAINETVYSSEVNGPIITSDEVDIFWTFDGTNFHAPVVIIDPIVTGEPQDIPENRVVGSEQEVI
jgi:hypothetical protein